MRIIIWPVKVHYKTPDILYSYFAMPIMLMISYELPCLAFLSTFMKMQQLPLLYKLLFCQELNTLTHCYWDLLLMRQSAGNIYKNIQLEYSCAFRNQLT